MKKGCKKDAFLVWRYDCLGVYLEYMVTNPLIFT